MMNVAISNFSLSQVGFKNREKKKCLKNVETTAGMEYSAFSALLNFANIDGGGTQKICF